jgi:hypothetical protein
MEKRKIIRRNYDEKSICFSCWGVANISDKTHVSELIMNERREIHVDGKINTRPKGRLFVISTQYITKIYFFNFVMLQNNYSNFVIDLI